jgi:hypothetical protein
LFAYPIKYFHKIYCNLERWIISRSLRYSIPIQRESIGNWMLYTNSNDNNSKNGKKFSYFRVFPSHAPNISQKDNLNNHDESEPNSHASIPKIRTPKPHWVKPHITRRGGGITRRSDR